MQDLWQCPTSELLPEARSLNRRLHGDIVSYVINRNCNFTNICNVGCTFCGFQRRAGDADAYTLTAEQVVERIRLTPWVGEVCLQGGIHPSLDFDYYLGLVRTIKEAFPTLHLHAFSPMEIEHLHRRSGRDYVDLLAELRDAGLGSIPGTAAEILVDEVRHQISGNKLSSDTWEQIIRTAHRTGLKSTATIMYGHVETWEHIRAHFERLHRIQEDTGGFTELVPLAFIPYRNRLGRHLADPVTGAGMAFDDFSVRSLERARRLYPLARIYFGTLIPNLQTSWVKLGVALAAESLGWGCNDFGGTLYEESITRESGGPHGECLTPGDIEEAIRSAGKTPVVRSTLYTLKPAKPLVARPLEAELLLPALAFS